MNLMKYLYNVEVFPFTLAFFCEVLAWKIQTIEHRSVEILLPGDVYFKNALFKQFWWSILFVIVINVTVKFV